MNYNNIPVLKEEGTGRRYYSGVKYPVIPLSVDDIYIITVFGDRLDVICDDYYGNTEDIWIISTANGLPGDSLYVTPGTQLRIPTNTREIKNNLKKLNGIS